ncbi:MAG: protein-L-isoaspartate(D-aspartate) O-methyltransferase [Armatimonadota bacterium]
MTERDSGNRYKQARERMVEQQLRRRGISDERLLEAMRKVPRHEFVPPGARSAAYSDRPLSIGAGQTISQPYMVAYMVEQLEAGPDDRILEVGAGSGYQAAILAELADEVYAIEYLQELADKARETVQRLGYDNVHIITGDGSKGYAEAAPYDGIIVAAAAPKISPAWKEQLAEGGRIVAPVGSRGSQICVVARMVDGELQTVSKLGCVFVPLLGKYGFGG